MEKYGVKEDKDNAKTGSAGGGVCPSCGKKTEQQGQTTLCPSCGSKPFEKEEQKHDKK
jgi:DNA-directed RNA polymerase subunit RPC12/RpoP